MTHKTISELLHGHWTPEEIPLVSENTKQEKTYHNLHEFYRDYDCMSIDPKYLKTVFLALRDKVRYVDLSEKEKRERALLLTKLTVLSGTTNLNKGAII
ncbi:MAG: hypothetical protein WC511_05125 [Candidatus Pacearchaeota archaeon]